jgi:hypothetical protein
MILGVELNGNFEKIIEEKALEMQKLKKDLEKLRKEF